MLLLLVAGASTGAGAAAVVVWLGALLELDVGSGCVGCFFFLRRLKRLRRPLLTWAKASSAVSEMWYLAFGLEKRSRINGGIVGRGVGQGVGGMGGAYGGLAS